MHLSLTFTVPCECRQIVRYNMARGIQGATNLTKNELSQHILQLSQARGDRKTEVDSSVVAADVEMAV